MFRCQQCKKEVLLLYYLSEYGQRARGKKDTKEYCRECFDKKFEEKHNDKSDKEWEEIW